MAYNRLVGLEKGKRAFYGCFQVSAAGGFVYIYTHARTRKGFGLGSCLENKTKSARLVPLLTSLENKTRSVMFRKLNKGRDEKTVNGFSRSSVGLFLLSKKRQTVAGCPVYVYVHTRARWLRSFSFGLFLSEKTLFSFSFFLYIFLSSFSFFCKSIILFLLSLS